MMMMMMMRVMTASSPRSAQLTPSAVYGRFGHPLDLNCRASRNTKPPPRVTWFKDGVAVVISDRLQIDSTRSRSLSRLSHKGGGISVVLGGGRVRGEDLNLSSILMYIVSMISSIWSTDNHLTTRKIFFFKCRPRPTAVVYVIVI